MGRVQHMLDTQVTSLHDPFARFGMVPSPSRAMCTRQLAQSIHTQIGCSAVLQAYTRLPADKIERANIEAQAKELQVLLQKNGWQGGSNGVTITSLISGMYRGIDYSPNAYYEKVIGTYDCMFDTMIAYANPKPPAVNSTFSCDRTVNILGETRGVIYDSSKGHL